MGSINKTPYFYRPKPLFGFDIGKGSIKIAQLSYEDNKPPRVIAYGTANFDSSAIEDGVITNPEVIAKAAKELFKHSMIGDVRSRRVAMTIPSYRTFIRSMQLPPLKPHELADAVRLETEQYIPMSLEEVYVDYTVISSTPEGIEVLVVAVPRPIVDSCLDLGNLLGLEVVLVETTMSANGRLFSHDEQSDVATVIIDFGTVSADISIYDRGIITTGTVEGGGLIFTQAIEKGLKVSNAEAAIIKTRYGLGKSRRQAEIHAALEPSLHKITTEIKRLIRYHSEHYGPDRPIQQVITLGGGANIPGLTDYFTNSVRLAVRTLDPWHIVNVGKLQPPAAQDHPMYASAIGAALTPPEDTFK